MGLGFDHGYNSLGMKHANNVDSGFAHWQRLEEWHPGNGWTFWEDLQPSQSTDFCLHLDVLSHYEGDTYNTCS